MVAVICAALFPVLPTGCGFRPLHGADKAANAGDLAQILIRPIADRTGQRLYNKLRDRLNPSGIPARPRYELRVALTSAVENLAIRKDEIATRANLRMTASVDLIDRKSGKAVFKAVSRSITSFNILQSYYSTVSSEENARSRAVGVLADDIRTRVSLYLRGASRS